jgi:hypothetical protein
MSIVFGTVDSFVSYDSTDMHFGTGDFTIEWFQYRTDTSPHTRIFSVGSYSNAQIAISIENNLGYIFWRGGTSHLDNIIPDDRVIETLNTWVHIAVTRQGETLRGFLNGELVASFSDNTNFTEYNNDFTIGNEGTAGLGTNYEGFITNFRVVKGEALYTANFNIPTSPISNVDGTELLLLSSLEGNFTVDSAKSRTVKGSNKVNYSIESPFEEVVVCLGPQTGIMMADGSEENIENIKENDEVVTNKGTTSVVKIIRSIGASPQDMPFIIPKGSLGDGKPYRNTYISPRHRFLHRGIMMTCKGIMLGGGNVPRLKRVSSGIYHYCHLALTDENLLFLANGIWVESYRSKPIKTTSNI